MSGFLSSILFSLSWVLVWCGPAHDPDHDINLVACSH